jgi:hypothetical protein
MKPSKGEGLRTLVEVKINPFQKKQSSQKAIRAQNPHGSENQPISEELKPPKS